MSEVRIPSVDLGWSVEGRRLSPTYPQAGNKSKAGSASGWKRGMEGQCETGGDRPECLCEAP